MGALASGSTMLSSFIGAGFKGAALNDEALARDRESAINVQIAQGAQADALRRGGVDAGKIRQKGSRIAEEQKVAYANSGVDSSVGTAANVQADTAAISELDAQTAKNNAAREAWGFGMKAEQLQGERTLNRKRADSARVALAVNSFNQMAGEASSGSANESNNPFSSDKKKRGY